MNNSKVAFQGEPGAYSELAAFEYYKHNITTLPRNTFEDVFTAVEGGIEGVDFGLIPIENSLAGSIHRNYDLMLRHNLHIVGEYHLRVSHCLLVLPGVKLKDLKRVHSHPQALAQCEANLVNLGVNRIAESDTAGSARNLRENGDREAGALASSRAAEVYELEILVDHMEDNPSNYTRFLVLARQPQEAGESGDDGYKTSIVFNLQNKPGVLFKALSVFALRDIDLTKIESRPIPGQLWEYMFYVDFAGHSSDKDCANALDNLGEFAPFLRTLGSYPRHHLQGVFEEVEK